MPDEEKPQEQVDQERQVQAAEVENRAKIQGWVPKEEFRGDSERWIPADEFVKRADHMMPILKSVNRKLETQVTDLNRKLAETHEIGKIVLGEAYAKGNARFRCDSLQFTALLYAGLAGIPWMRVSPPRWKKHCVGKAFATKQEYKEKAMEKWPELGIQTDDEAAALFLMEFSQVGDEL